MTMLPLAADISNYSGVPTAEQAKCLFDAGYHRVIVGTQDSLTTQAQIDVLKAAGIAVEAYTYLRFDQDAHAQMVRGIAALGGRVVDRMWLDAEDATAEALAPEAVVGFLMEAARACEGVIISGIYTRESWWTPRTGGSEEFKDFPLWFATNDQQGDLSFTPFGGWMKAEMEQYAFNKDLCGVNVDLNVYGPPALTPGALSPPFMRDDLLPMYLAVYELQVGGPVATIEPQPLEEGHRVYKVTML